MNHDELQLSQAEQRREDERRLKTIVHDLWNHSERLVKAELELGLDEVNKRVEEGKVAVKKAAITGGIIGGLFYAAYLALLAALIMGLGSVMPTWAAALIVGVLSGIAGYVMVQREKKIVKEEIAEPIRNLPHNIAPRAHS